MTKIDLNTAPFEALRAIEGIDGMRAKYLLRARPFKDWEDVTIVDGIDDVLLEKIRAVAIITPPNGGRGSSSSARRSPSPPANGQGTSSIDLNTASMADLQRIEGIDGTRAQKLLDHRDQYGPFETWQDVERVEGFDDRLIEQMRRVVAL